jgi:hypothetical protein
MARRRIGAHPVLAGPTGSGRPGLRRLVSLAHAVGESRRTTAS